MTRSELNSFILNLLPNNIRRLISPTRTRDALAKVADYAEELQASESPWKGEATPSTNPPSSGFFIYQVLTQGTYTNFRDNNNASIIVIGSELEDNRVELWVQNGVSKKVLYATGGSSAGNNFANTNLTLDANRSHNANFHELEIRNISNYNLEYGTKTETLRPGSPTKRLVIPNDPQLSTILLDVDFDRIINSAMVPTEIYQHVQPYSGDQEIMQLAPPVLTTSTGIATLDYGTQKYGRVRTSGQFDDTDTITFSYAVPFENGSAPSITMESVGTFDRVLVNVESTNLMTDPTMRFGFNVRFSNVDSPGDPVNLPWFFYHINGH